MPISSARPSEKINYCGNLDEAQSGRSVCIKILIPWNRLAGEIPKAEFSSLQTDNFTDVMETNTQNALIVTNKSKKIVQYSLGCPALLAPLVELSSLRF